MTPTEPGTPQTAAGRALHRLRAHDDILPHILAIEAEARSARDAEVRTSVEALPTRDYATTRPTADNDYIGQWVDRDAVLAILDADTPS